MRGGARVRSGPLPTSTDRSHKADGQGWTTLPSEGRNGPEPAWPLVNPTDRELELWSRLWCSPQATQWHEEATIFEVACYVRVLAAAERKPGSVGIWQNVRQQADSLGLTVAGMQRLRWRVGDAPTGDDEPDEPTGIPSLTDRLRAVRGG